MNSAQMNSAQLNWAQLRWTQLSSDELSPAQMNSAQLNWAQLRWTQLSSAQPSSDELSSVESPTTSNLLSVYLRATVTLCRNHHIEGRTNIFSSFCFCSNCLCCSKLISNCSLSFSSTSFSSWILATAKKANTVTENCMENVRKYKHNYKCVQHDPAKWWVLKEFLITHTCEKVQM